MKATLMFSTGLVLSCLLATVWSAAIDTVAAVPPTVEEPIAPDDLSEDGELSENEARGMRPPYNNRPLPPPLPLPEMMQPLPYPPPLHMEGHATDYGPSAFGPTGSAFHHNLNVMDGGPPDIPMKVLDTNVECEKSYMTVYFKLSRPFYGFVYPYANFDKCVLFVGRGETDIKLTLSHDMCGAPPLPKSPGYSMRSDPIMEHRIMIQWETDLVQEYDTNILVRCDRPEDYNRTVKFDLATVAGEKQASVVRTHPGPQMWMEIQRGEGPKAVPLLGPVYLGETLSLVFTLADDVFNFDSNVLNCWATDGNSERQMLTYNDGYQGRPMLTHLPVIENSCSIKPKLFGHFQKAREEFSNAITTTQWVLFKAFRFPTTGRVLVQCDIQVCFEKCYPLPPCGIPFDIRSKERKRRETDMPKSTSSAIQPEMLTMFREIEVFLPDDNIVPMAMFNGSTMGPRVIAADRTDCLSTTTFYGVILGLGIALLIVIAVGAGYVQHSKKDNNRPKS